jgi:nucleotide-binding universal stress UspA family protein
MFSRILIAVADDEIADRVIEAGRSLAQALGAHLGLVHVVDLAVAGAVTATPMAEGGSPLATQEIIQAQEQSGEAFIARAAQVLGGDADAFLREGSTTSEIIAAATEWRADLIVIGTHGRSGVGRLVLGSVAEGVLRDAPCPVLTLRLGAIGG